MFLPTLKCVAGTLFAMLWYVVWCVVCCVLMFVVVVSVVEWWIVVFAKLVVSVLSSTRWLSYGVQKRDVTSMTIPENNL